MTKTYDVLVLGGGTGGTAAAKAAHAAGARTAMFNDGELGGLCILRGCMPTKTMLHAAHLAHEARHHHTPGVRVDEVLLDFPAIMANKDVKVARFKNAEIRGIEAAGYEVIDARARFTGPDTVEANGTTYRFTSGAVLATGSVVAVPPVDGIADIDYLTSDDVMSATELPPSLIVIGTGAIGLELAQFYARMGTHVTIVSRRRVFTDVDPLITEEMEAALRAEPNLDLLSPAPPLRVRRDSDAIVLTVAVEGSEREVRASKLLLATGRRAAVDGMGLDAAGVAVERGVVTCGPDMRTTNPKVFVAGDASGRDLLLHVANWEGAVAGRGAAGAAGPHAVEQRLKMEVVFTDPPLATIGMSEARAAAAGHQVVTASARFPETGRAITMDVRHGAWKIVADAQSGEILGSQILGPRADDLVHVVSTAMYYHGTAEDLLAMPWYHPTVAEVLLGLARDLQAQVGRG